MLTQTSVHHSVDLVINYDIPSLARDYVHRVGRTARAGRGGWALSLVTQHDVDIIQEIERLVDHQLTEMALEENLVLKVGLCYSLRPHYNHARLAALH